MSVRRAVQAGALALILLSACATLPRGGLSVLPQVGLNAAWQGLAGGIDYARITLPSPPLVIHALRIDLQTPGLGVIVTPGRGGSGMTSGRRVSSFAAEFGCVAAVNGGPFSPRLAVEGQAMRLVGLAVSRGVLVSRPDPRYAALLFLDDGRAEIVQQSADMDLRHVTDAVGGFFIVLGEGRVVGRAAAREPRTVAGISRDGSRLYVFVADGRRSGSVGLTDEEAGAWLLWLGARDGLCLDGGGSSALCIRRGDGAAKLVNVPVHAGIVGWERVVGNCLGFVAPP